MSARTGKGRVSLSVARDAGVAALLLACSVALAPAATTINATDNNAYGANVGWINLAGDTANGVVIGEYVCSGYAWGANVGWINFGGGAPANGIRYGNASASDFGVNLDPFGNLSGDAWGANIGWIVFEPTYGQPRVNLQSGVFSGAAWGANVGWISLDDLVAHQFVLRTDRIQRGADTDSDGIPDAFELEKVGNLTTFTSTSDTDHDGSLDVSEARAGTNPLDSNDWLHVTSYALLTGGTTSRVSWASTLSRFYNVQVAGCLTGTPSWADSGLGLMTPGGTSMTTNVPLPAASNRFYRVQAVRPILN